MILQGTPEHKIYIKNKGLVALKDVHCYDTPIERNTSWQRNLLSIMVYFIRVMKGVDTIIQTVLFYLRGRQVSTVKSGLTLEGASLMAGIFITKMEILITTALKILNACLHLSIYADTMKEEKIYERSNLFGQIAKKAKTFLGGMPKKWLKTPHYVHVRAEIVEIYLKLNILEKYIALIFAPMLQVANRLKKPALSAKLFFGLELTKRKRLKPVHIIAVGRLEGKASVYNLTIADAHLFYANGILSSNTDGEDHAPDTLRC